MKIYTTFGLFANGVKAPLLPACFIEVCNSGWEQSLPSVQFFQIICGGTNSKYQFRVGHEIIKHSIAPGDIKYQHGES